ncbi:2'-5' RNA ligase family protein [Bosea sp. BH3]|uniref:2'-5' RNA ligase family protein n=1 Tax=Bosea sp. BH3 TaxID=2871701 RepID=UPI0021CB4326|nr:2'-5' RNA ligase family protein [Bosea sp. BH3]MCU4180342.1 2'-5' RNA ligase family protein [Bosea sp. BH3]
MNDTAAFTLPVFCADSELGYRRSLTDFSTPLLLDDSYRLAHLPLVAPEHPRLIARREDGFYEMGRHARVFSLVLPVEDEALRASPAFVALEEELKAAPFATKIAWEILPRRSDRLHATVCGSLGLGEPPAIAPEAREALGRIEPFAVELRGLLSGNVNRGRLYLAAYPEKRDGSNRLQAVQAAFGRAPGDLWLVGLYNLKDDLDAAETAALAEIVSRWWNRPLLRFTASQLQLMGASDDLVLDAHVEAVLPLGARS